MTCQPCTRDKTITLVNGKAVCSYCEAWKVECLEREKDARRFLSMPREQAIAEYRKRKESGENLSKMDAVIARLKK